MGLFLTKLSSRPHALTPTSPYGKRPAWMTDGIPVTLYTGHEWLDVVGESFHEDELWAIAKVLAGARRGQEVRTEIIALLVAEAGNPYDPNAVGVWIGGYQVGHLPRSTAPAMRAAIIRLQEEKGQPVGISGRLVGGGPGRANLGVFLDYDPADFGLASHSTEAAEPGHVRTGLSELIYHSGDRKAWEVVAAGGDSLRHIGELHKLLSASDDLIIRHFAYAALEDALYRGRDSGPEVLPQYDEACGAHLSELPQIRQPLLAGLGVVPVVGVFRQASIRWQKAHEYQRSLEWAQAGLSFYAGATERRDEIADLDRRVHRCQDKLTTKPKASRPRATEVAADGPASEPLTCQTCGKEFHRLVRPGRKPHECAKCRADVGGYGALADSSPDSATAGLTEPATSPDSAVSEPVRSEPVELSSATSQDPELPLAGWFENPLDANEWRYWDGARWSDHTAPRC